MNKYQFVNHSIGYLPGRSDPGAPLQWEGQCWGQRGMSPPGNKIVSPIIKQDPHLGCECHLQLHMGVPGHGHGAIGIKALNSITLQRRF